MTRIPSSLPRIFRRPALLLAPLLAAALVGCSEPAPPTVNLYRAIHSDDLEQIKRHLHHGTDINQPDREGHTPLHVAAEQGRVVVARLLLDQGARLDATDQAGRTPLQAALLAGKVQVAQLFVERAAKYDAQALLFEVTRGDVTFRDVVEFLVELGADVNARDASGMAPLHIAVDKGLRVMAKRLIERGADVDAPAADGRTPLAMAQAAGDQDLVRLLQRFGAAPAP